MALESFITGVKKRLKKKPVPSTQVGGYDIATKARGLVSSRARLNELKIKEGTEGLNSQETLELEKILRRAR